MEAILITVAGTLALIGVVAFWIIKRLRKDAWEGQLIDKRVETSSGGDYDTTNYVLYVKTTDGMDKRSFVRKKHYEQFSIGDQLVKVKGETYPKKVV